MFKPFKRLPADPSKRFYTPFLRLSDKNISRIYSQSSGDPEVKALYGFDSVVRINSTYLELVDRFYNWRGMWTTAGAFLFCLFFGVFCYTTTLFAISGKGGFIIWFTVILTWGITLPLCLGLYRMMTSEVFLTTYYPIRFNRKNGMVYVYQSGGTVLTIPWKTLRFAMYETKMPLSTQWTIVGCVPGEDGDTITRTIPLPIDLSWGPEMMLVYWEFIRCYMEEGDEYLPDLADTVPWCPPVENRREGWLFGLLYLCRQVSRLGLVVNVLQFPILFVLSFPRWLVMRTSTIPVWPPEVEAACRPDENDPVNKGAEHNPPQIWRPMLAWQGKECFAKVFARERSASERIIARLKAKYGDENDAG